jgi:HK97 family phage major capsid protein
MNIAQLETDLRAKQTAAKDLLEKTMRAAEAHVVSEATDTTPKVTGRLMTAEEKAAVQAILNDAKEIKGRIDAAQSDANLTAEIEKLTAGMTGGGSHGAQPTRETRSLGEQFVSDAAYRQWVTHGGPQRNGTWNSPKVELHAATFTTDSASGGVLVLPDYRPGFIPLATRRLVVADLITPGTTDSNLISFVKELAFTNAADAVAQGAAKPESSLTFEAATAAVKKIAHWMAVTKEMLEDFSQTRSIIDGRLRLGLDLKEEDELLNGSGAGAHQLGLMNLAGLAAAIARGADTNADVILRQVTAISIATFLVPDAFIMNPANWLTIQLTKNAAGNYLGSGPWAPAQPAQLWGLPGAITPAIVANTSLVGAFKAAAQFFRKGGVTVEATNSHADFFIKNLVAILAEERGALVSYRDAAFGKVTGLN